MYSYPIFNYKRCQFLCVINDVITSYWCILFHYFCIWTQISSSWICYNFLQDVGAEQKIFSISLSAPSHRSIISCFCWWVLGEFWNKKRMLYVFLRWKNLSWKQYNVCQYTSLYTHFFAIYLCIQQPNNPRINLMFHNFD